MSHDLAKTKKKKNEKLLTFAFFYRATQRNGPNQNRMERVEYPWKFSLERIPLQHSVLSRAVHQNIK